jgi:HAD superfamily hydrolase (TIGR01484 family)
MTPKAVIFDIDGTIAWSKQAVTNEMGEHLANLLQYTKVGIMSGAGFLQYKYQVLTALPASTHNENLTLFPTNASQRWHFENGAWATSYDLTFSDEERKHVMTVLTTGLRETGLDQISPLWGEQIEDRGPQITFSALGQKAPLDEKKKWDPDHKKRAPLTQYLRENLPEFSIGSNATTSIDITRKGITKAYGVEQFAKQLGCAPFEMLYIGDALFEGGNDAVVIPTGIQVRQVENPDQTAMVIEELVAQFAQQ